MLKSLAIFAVVFTITQASIPIPRQTPNRSTPDSQKQYDGSDHSKNPSPTASLVAMPKQDDGGNKAEPQERSDEDQKPAINVTNPAPVPESWTWHDKVAWGAGLVLVVVGFLAVCAAYKTLKAVEKQAKLTDDQIQMVKSKERAKLVVKLGELFLYKNSGVISGDEVHWSVRLYGITEASDIFGDCLACIGDPKGNIAYTFGLMGDRIALPEVISPEDRIKNGSVELRSTLSGAAEGPVPGYELIWQGSVFVYCAGFVNYKDVFGDRWVVSFKKKWIFYPEGQKGPDGEKGMWIIEEGDEKENEEVKAEPLPAAVHPSRFPWGRAN
jgi:hypothetical protein